LDPAGDGPTTDIRLFCVSVDCAQHFGADSGVLFPAAGALSISAVPEPRTSLLLTFGTLAAMSLFATSSDIFRKIRSFRGWITL